jgi:biotin carboxyl carrier protein
MRTFEFKPAAQDEAVSISIERSEAEQGGPERYAAVIGDRRLDVETWKDSPVAGWMRLANKVVPYRVHRTDGEVHVWIDGSVHRFQRVQRVAQRATGAAAAAASNDLAAPMPGTILKINVSPGDRFEAHAPLIVMESMKMEMTLSAPFAGTVKEVLCEPGKLVEMNALLARLEPDLDD